MFMNETEAQELYQKIFSSDRIERWESWKRYCNTEGRLPEGVDHPLARIPEKKRRWNGGMSIKDGYRRVMVGSHPASSNGYVLEHILVAEIALGRFLPEGAVVHHSNENKLDNYSDGNIVICESRAFHNLLHKRMRALRECGHADWLWCSLCKQWDSPDRLYVGFICNRVIGRHRECNNAYKKQRRAQVN